MATTPPSPSLETLDPTPEKSEPEAPQSISQDPSSLPPPSSTPPPMAAAPPSPSPSSEPAVASAENPKPSPILTSTPTAPNPTPTPTPNPNPNPTLVAPPPPSIPSFTPSFRPLGAPQYSTYTNPSYPMAPNPGLQPPGVSAPGYAMAPPGASSGIGTVTVSMPQMRPPYMYPGAPGQNLASAPMAYGQAPNGYLAVPGAPQQPIHPPVLPLGSR